MKKLVTGFLSLVLAFGLQAADQVYHLKSGASDWTDPLSYVEEAKPSANDIVILPEETFTVSAAADFGLISALKRVQFSGANSTIVFAVPEHVSYTLRCQILYRHPTEGWKDPAMGAIVKRGDGELVFELADKTQADDSSYALYTSVCVEAGQLVLPQNYYAYDSFCYLNSLAVSNGATVVTAMRSADCTQSAIHCGSTSVGELWGSGTLTNRSAEAMRLIVSGKDRWSEFSGRLMKNIRWHATGWGRLTGTESNMTYANATVAGGKTAFMKAGNKADELSSLGKGTFYWRSAGSFLYLGAGETTDKDFVVADSSAGGPAVFDGGEQGGFLSTGSWSGDTLYPMLQRLVLQGEGAPCEIAGSIRTWTSGNLPYTFYLAKKGSGTWKISKDTNSWSGGLAVEDGTLQFTSVKERGEQSALGTATNLTEDIAAPRGEQVAVPYAFKLGGDATVGSLEYVGSAKAWCVTRPAVVRGKGGMLSNASSAFFGLLGVPALESGEHDLVVGGSGTGLVGDVSDGSGKVSLVKKGVGTWYLDKVHSFTGDIRVEAGTLVLEDPSAYSWFKWTIQSRPSGGNQSHINCREFAIYDADGVRINNRLEPFTNYYAKSESLATRKILPPGMIGYDRVGSVSDTTSGNTRPLEALCDDGTSLVAGRNTYAQMTFKTNGVTVLVDRNDEGSWIPVVMHLASGQKPAVKFDFVQANDGNSRFFDSFKLEGSVDGENWEIVTNMSCGTIDDIYKLRDKWWSNGVAYEVGSAASHAGGLPIRGTSLTAKNALAGVRAVSVASGATLRSMAPAKVAGIRVDVKGGGTLDNIGLDEDGQIDVTGVEGKLGATTIPLHFVNSPEDSSDMTSWTVSVNGNLRAGLTVKRTADGIQIVPKGMILILR